MEQLNEELTSSSPELTRDQDPRSVTRATVFLIKKSIAEKVHSVSVMSFSVSLIFTCVIILKQLFSSGSVNIGEYLPLCR
jgi:hypothetical protein